MNDELFQRTMRSIGLTCFVRHYELLTDTRKVPGDAAAELGSRESFTVNTCQSKVSASRRIVREGRTQDALRMFLSSKVSDYDLERKARRLLLA
ncbi:MAG TPA: hypothetical protein VGO52_26780 [Hyphomonadaceae bacterium]|jgi:hypothetical protein|nr:hypothetical protein [Hyphomonadaceae bacterium]